MSDSGTGSYQGGSVSSGTAQFTVTQVAGVQVTAPVTALAGPQGSTAWYAVTITNSGNGSDSFALAAASVGGWPVAIYRDDNGDGVHQATETTIISSTGALPMGGTLACFVAVTIPGGAVAVDSESLTATSSFDPAQAARVSLTTTPTQAPPVANFTATPTTGVAPLTVAFTDTSTGSPTTWNWTFGDGATSTAQNPSHTYSAAGSYTVSLTVSGGSTKTQTNYITVSAPPTANFTATPTSGLAPLSVQFTDTSAGSPTSWSWSFGDGATSTAQNPSHTYRAAGSYTVSLKVNGGNTKTQANCITVSAPLAANFSVSPASGAAPLSVQFTDTSTGSPTGWSWNFGDGATSTAESPGHTYRAAGTYTVSVTVTGSGGATNTKTQPSCVVVSASASVPVASFTGTPTSGPALLTVQFTDTSTGSPTSWNWDFGDGATSTAQNPSHTYRAVGIFTVKLTVFNSTGSFNTATQTDYITVTTASAGPVPDFTATPTSGPAPLTVQFTDASTGAPTGWSWDFGDGGTSTAQNPSHTYSAAGSYTVALTVTNAAGSNTMTASNPITVTAPGALTADFSASATAGSIPFAVQFTDLSTGNPTSWQWDFGDHATSTDQNPSHTYTSPGHYTVSLTVGANGASDTMTKKSYLKVGPRDVSAKHWAFYQIVADWAAKVVQGYPDGTYHPDGIVTRDQMAVYLARAIAGGDSNVPVAAGVIPFNDVQSNQWARQYIAYLKDTGVVEGYGDGNYRPYQSVTRGQMAVFITRATAQPLGEVGLASYDPPATPSFTDVPATYWAYKYIEDAKSQGVVAGYPDGAYRPDEVVTRAQMAVFLQRAFNLPM